MVPRLAAALDTLRQIGAKRFLMEIPPWLLCRRYVFYCAAPVDAAPPYPCQISFSLDPVCEEDLPHLVSARPGFYTLTQIRTRLGEGHLAFVGRSREEIVHIRWVFVGAAHLPYLSRRLLLAPDECFLDEVYTVPRWRRKGVETAAAYEMQRALHARGFERIICAIAAWNLTPQRVAERQGYKKVGSGGYWAIAGYRRFFWDGILEDRHTRDLVVPTAG